MLRYVHSQTFQIVMTNTPDFSTPAPGTLLRHTDGGCYRFHGLARHSESLEWLCIYEHLWPFAPGWWARPAAEWAGRFTPMTAEALETARAQDRLTAQAAVTQHKAARRAAAQR